MKNHCYNYYVVNIGDNNEEAYQVIVPKFPKLHIFVDPKLDNIHEVVAESLDIAIKSMKKEGLPIPPVDKKPKFSGKVLLRLKPQLHEKLYRQAQANQTSLNKYIESRLQ